MSREPDDLLDHTPEAEAMRRTREARARAAEGVEQTPDAKGRGRRRLIVGAALGALMAARVFERAVRGGR